MNPAFSSEQVVAALNHLSATHLIIGAETNLPRKPPKSNLPILQRLMPDLQKLTLESECVPSLKSIILVENSEGRQSIENLRAATPYEHIAGDGGPGRPIMSKRGLDPDEVVNIQFTSGTTSTPKAVTLTLALFKCNQVLTLRGMSHASLDTEQRQEHRSKSFEFREKSEYLTAFAGQNAAHPV